MQEKDILKWSETRALNDSIRLTKTVKVLKQLLLEN